MGHRKSSKNTLNLKHRPNHFQPISNKMNRQHQHLLPGYNCLLFLFFAFLFGSCTQESPRKIELLFLGHDSEHHNAEKYLPLLAAALTPKGINFTYTANPDDLNPENLALYDGLVLYANHDSISPYQEKALLQFVKSGKGFIPIHCASYCFRNSKPFVNLVGAQFKEHQTGTFTASITSKDHPITANLSAFETWDETYVHHLHNEDRTVLLERVEGDHREPWTWVRQHGKGRVFYTAYGHDERTWDHPGFHTLMEKGIRWAVGDKLAQNAELLTFPTLEYSEAKLPNYEKRDPPPKLQAPLSPEASQKLIQIPPGFKLELFASEPDIGAPISANWDEKGRLWLLETEDYPNEINTTEGVGNDKIKILEDTDGDGTADKFTVFADNLSVPTSLVFHNGGVIVSQAPHFLFLKDTDGDDKADIREIIMTGWGTYDTHAGPSNLKYGFDNWLYGTVGYSSFKGKVGPDSLKFRQGVYRFKPDASKMEFVGATTNNTWGLGFSETFDLFVSTANNTHSAYLGIPDRFADGVLSIPSPTVKKIEGHYGFHPITKNVRQVDVFGGFTAAAGHNLYTAREFPKEYWNRIAFVCEPTGHLLHRAILERAGAGFKEKDGWNILASADEWVSPVHAEVGPDGALWILDWYNFIIQHNPTPTGFENGPGNAHINPYRDKNHGRIYRLVHQEAKPFKPIQLDINKPEELVQQLKNDNLFWRLHAQRLLVERGGKDIISDLIAIIKNKSVDEIGLNSPAVHALWTLYGLNALDGSHQKALQSVRIALQHPAAGVRKAALQVLPKKEENRATLLRSNCLFDSDSNTQMEALLALSQLPPADTIGQILYQLNQAPNLVADEWLAKALYIAMAKHKDSFIKALQQNEPALLELPQEQESEAEQQLSPLALFLKHYGAYAGLIAENIKAQNQSQPADQIIQIKTIKDQMKYDVESFTVTAGTTVEIVFENNDAMQHNLLLLEPGTLEPVGKAAEVLGQTLRGPAKGYIPEVPFILAATTLLNPGDTFRLRLAVPEKAGDYPYVCTFPGHWRTMNGVMKVVAKSI